MRHLTILECPVTFTDENGYSQSSIAMCPTIGISHGLVSRHVKVQDARLIVVCIWTSQADSEIFLDAAWYAKAAGLWGDDYQLRLESLDETNCA